MVGHPIVQVPDIGDRVNDATWAEHVRVFGKKSGATVGYRVNKRLGAPFVSRRLV